MTVSKLLIATLVGVTALVMTTFGVIDYYRVYHARINQLRAKLDNISDQLSTALANPVWTVNTTDIAKIVESYMKDKEVYVVFVEDEKRFIGRIQNDIGDALSIQNRQFSKGDFYREKNIFFNGEEIGVFGVSLTAKFMKKQLRSSLFYFLVSLLILIFCLVSISFFILMKTVFTPLKIIENYAKRMCGSPAMEDIHIPGSGFTEELDNLKNSIQDMTGQLKARYHELKKSQADLKETEKKYREIFNNATEGIFQTTQDGRLITANPALAHILGYDSPHDLLTSAPNVVTDGYVDPAKRDDFIAQIHLNKRIKNFEVEAYRKDRSIISISITAHSVFDEQNTFLYYEGMIEDITQKKKAEELKIAKDAAEATSRAKNVFLASMSHEIRTPINAIIGLTGLAGKTELTARQQDYVAKIGSSANDLLGIISDILDFSKIEAGELNIDQVDFPLDEVWQSLSEIFARRIAEKKLEFNFFKEEDIPAILNGDPLRVRQILINLLGNAIKFTQKGGITIRVSVAMKSDDRVMLKFSVQDTGIGIAEGKINTIFSPFTQGEPFITRKYGGTGLGLSICKQLVEMMGGQIWVNSRLGHGSCFIFTASFGLRARERKQQGVHRQKTRGMIADNRSLRGTGILLVEDNSINRQVAREILESLGMRVESARNGIEAVKIFSALAAEDPVKLDAVLMDVQMPEMNGFEVTRKIREWESSNPPTEGAKRLPEIPIIAMTAHAMTGDREECLAVGMNDYLTKPIDEIRLVDTLKKWISAKSEEGSIIDGMSEAIAERKTDDPGSDTGQVPIGVFGGMNLPGLNVTKGITRLHGNHHLYVKLLREFVQDHANDIHLIRQSLDDGDIRLARRLIHTFKGVVASIAADDLAVIARDMDETVKQDIPLSDSMLDAAQKMITEVADSIGKISIPEEENGNGVRPELFADDKEEIAPVFSAMYQLLKENRIDADKYLSHIASFLINSGYSAFAGKLETSMGQFNFRESRAIVEKIAGHLNISLE